MSGEMYPRGYISGLSHFETVRESARPNLSTMVDTAGSSTGETPQSPTAASTNVDVPGGQGLRPGLVGGVWCDLFLEHLEAECAAHRVTQRAMYYAELGIPLAEVFRALKCDQAGWEARVAAWEAWRAENRAATKRATEGAG